MIQTVSVTQRQRMRRSFPFSSLPSQRARGLLEGDIGVRRGKLENRLGDIARIELFAQHRNRRKQPFLDGHRLEAAEVGWIQGLRLFLDGHEIVPGEGGNFMVRKFLNESGQDLF